MNKNIKTALLTLAVIALVTGGMAVSTVMAGAPTLGECYSSFGKNECDDGNGLAWVHASSNYANGNYSICEEAQNGTGSGYLHYRFAFKKAGDAVPTTVRNAIDEGVYVRRTCIPAGTGAPVVTASTCGHNSACSM